MLFLFSAMRWLKKSQKEHPKNKTENIIFVFKINIIQYEQSVLATAI